MCVLTRNGHARTMKLYLSLAQDYGLNVVGLLNQQDCLKMTALHLGAIHGREHVTHQLLENGAFADAKYDNLKALESSVN